jgi:hypothetical protein
LAFSGPLPPQIACRFTVGELAVLRIVGDEMRRQGVCVLCIDALAGRAGVSRSTVKNALREARRLGLVTVTERRRRGLPSLSNVVRVIDGSWLAWLRHQPGRGGVNFLITTDNQHQSGRRNGFKPIHLTPLQCRAHRREHER